MPLSIIWNRAGDALKFLGPAVIKAVYPKRCIACGRLMPMPEHRDSARIRPWFCEECSQDVNMVVPPFCIQCGRVFESRAGPKHLCKKCMDKKNKFTKARATAIYEGSVKRAILNYKYRRNAALARPLGALLKEAYDNYYGNNETDFIIPVPLHIRRLRWRKFNQAWLLIDKWKAPDFPTLLPDVLVRKRWTRPQAGLDNKERAKNIKGAFAINHDVKGKSILLVDDVFTTGATVNECSKVLLAGGAKQVDILTLARVL